jgi:imidazolonepropionase-like amidohydrolase
LDLWTYKEDNIPRLKSLSNSPQYAYFYTSAIAADVAGGITSSRPGLISMPNPTDTETAKEFIENRIKNGADFIKIYHDSGTRRYKPPFSDSLFEFLIAETHRHKKVATVHIGTVKDARIAFDKGADILAHLWKGQDGTVTEADLQNWQKRPFYITPTLLTHKAIVKINTRLFPLPFDTYVNEVGRLKKANISILAGNDGPNDEFKINIGTDLYKELELFVQAGMTPLEALQTATINPAKAFKLKDKGVIKKGMTADFVLVNGNVLNNIQELNKVESVWKQGTKIR